jgi:hypothetical protein
MSEKRWLALILILFVLLGITYAVITPAFEASDELWHYPMVRHLADGNPLPVQVFDPDLAGPWRQEASQPPLYYWLGAALTFWIDTSDMDEVRRENPHVDNGLITRDGNRNLVVHNPSANAPNPWQGTLLAVRIVRLFSVLISAITVYLTYRIARKASPNRPEIALGAAAANAFLPMFLFISGSVNNDNLAIMLASLALFLMIRLVVKEQPGHIEGIQWLLLGCVIGLGLLTKEGTIGLLPLAWGTAFVVAWRQDKHQYSSLSLPLTKAIKRLVRLLGKSLLVFALILGPVLLIAGWWYYRNIQLYGDWLGWSAFIAVLGERGHPASLAQLWGERRGFLMSYWGLFGGVNLPMPSWIYSVLNTLLLISVAGFVYYFLHLIKQWVKESKGQWRTFNDSVNILLQFISTNFALVACLIFVTAVVFGLIQWATTTWSSQGRLVFTALSALSVLFVTGLVGWLPQRPARWVAGVTGGFLFVTAALAPFLWIQPHYQPDSYISPQPYVLHPQDTTFGESLRLRGVSVETVDNANGAAIGEPDLQPGDPIWVHLEWEVLQKMDGDWSVFIHLIDPVLGRPIAQRDMYLGQGLLLTSWLETGQRLVNSYQLQIPETALAPVQLDLAVGLYNFDTGERLTYEEGKDLALIAKLDLGPLIGETPNPIQVNFEDELLLSGFELQPRRLSPGETVNLTLFWQAQRHLDRDYTLFAQVLGEDTVRWASYDLKPAEGTSSWQPGVLMALPLSLTVDENTPPGLYPLIVGLYTQDAQGNFNRLQILTEDGRLTDDFLELTQIRVD